ncbi:hypothetical protein MGN70_003270 [Eutypa lata]|nr:hypothetical protein MGN70_003270 [Eutypa lata]
MYDKKTDQAAGTTKAPTGQTSKQQQQQQSWRAFANHQQPRRPTTSKTTTTASAATSQTSINRNSDMFSGEVVVKPAGMPAEQFFSGKSYNKIKVNQEEFRRDCEYAGFGWPPRTLKDSRWAK